MRILYIHQYFCTPKNSSGTRSYEFAKRLVESRNEVILITTNTHINLSFNENEKIKRTMIDGIKLIVLNSQVTNKTSFKKRIISFLSFALKATKIGKREKVDIVFATSTPLTVAYPAIKIAKKQKIPMIFEVRDVWPDIPIKLGILKNPLAIYFAKKLEMKAYKKANKIIALSPDMADNIISKGIKRSKLQVIPNASDNKLFNGIEKENLEEFIKENPVFKKKAILYTGTIGFVNGLKYMVDLAYHMKRINKEVVFVIIGDGKEKEKVKEYAEKMGIFGDNFFILKPLPKKEVVYAMKASTFLTSFVINNEVLWANSANKFFDSLAASKPLIINYKGWQKKILEENRAGISIPPENPAKGSEMINTLLNDISEYKIMCKNAKKLALENFDRDKLFKDFYKVFNEIYWRK